MTRVRTTATAVALLVISAGIARGETIQERCASEWPDDFAMRAHCVERHQEAVKKVGAWVQNHFPGAMDGDITTEQARQHQLKDPERYTIFNSCATEWPGPDYVMMWHCIERQEQALAKIGPTQSASAPSVDDGAPDTTHVQTACRKIWPGNTAKRWECYEQQIEVQKKLDAWMEAQDDLPPHSVERLKMIDIVEECLIPADRLPSVQWSCIQQMEGAHTEPQEGEETPPPGSQ